MQDVSAFFRYNMISTTERRRTMPQVTLVRPGNQQIAPKLRVCAYCRVSTDSKDQLNSYARQIQVYTDTIRRYSDWEMVEIFADEGISGTASNNRTQFQRMIKLCEQRQIDLILTKSISRFARNTKETLEYVRKLKLLGVGVQFEKEGINTLSLGDGMLLSTFASIAQEESVSISNNIRLANQKRMENGTYISSNAPYGYRLINGKLEIFESEAKIVRQIFREYANGKSISEIAKILEQTCVKSKSGKQTWKYDVISYILSNERYAGDMLCQKYFNTSIVPFRKTKNRGEKDQYYISNSHPAIVEQSEFDIVQTLLSQRRSKYAHAFKLNIYPLTSRIQCSECGSVYRRRITNGCISWGCNKHIHDRTACDSHYYREERIYDSFIRMINTLRFGSENIIEESLRLLNRAILMSKRNNTEAKDASREISEMNAKLLMLEQLRNKGYLAVEIYQSQAKELQLQISRLKEQRQRSLESPLETAIEELKKVQAFIGTIDNPLENFPEQLFKDIVQSIRINNHDEITITFLGGISLTEIL